MSTPPEKQCSRCRKPNTIDSNYCAWCGASEFESDPQQRLLLTFAQADQYRLKLDTRRLIAFGIISFGLYILFWALLTWIQLKRETGGNFFPPWHALSLLVPIYSLFRLHHHVQVIKELCDGSGVPTNLSPRLVIVMFLLSGILDVIAAIYASYGQAIVLRIISLTLLITILIWAQSALNGYWTKTREAELKEVPTSTIELVISLLGVLSWTALLVPIN